MILRNRLLGLLVLLVFLSGCAAPPPPQATRADELQNLKIGIVSFIGFAPLYITQNEALCRPYGIDLEVVETDDVSLLSPQLQSGEIDVAVQANTTIVPAKPAGVEMVAFLAMDYSDGADGIVATAAIESIADMVEQKATFGADIASTTYFLFMVLAAREGFAPSDFNHVQMESGIAAASFLAGAVDVAGTYEPWMSQALDREGAHILLTSADEPGIIADVFVALPETIAHRSDALVALGNCWYDTLAFMEENPVPSMEIMAAAMGLSVAEVEEQMGTIYWPKREEGLAYLRDGALYDLFETSVQLFTSMDLLDGPVGDLNELIDVGIAEKVSRP